MKKIKGYNVWYGPNLSLHKSYTPRLAKKLTKEEVHKLLTLYNREFGAIEIIVTTKDGIPIKAAKYNMKKTQIIDEPISYLMRKPATVD